MYVHWTFVLANAAQPQSDNVGQPLHQLLVVQLNVLLAFVLHTFSMK